MNFRYEVRFQKNGGLKDSSDYLEYAKGIAIAMGNWNQPCDVIDTETGEKVYVGQAYSEPMVVN